MEWPRIQACVQLVAAVLVSSVFTFNMQSANPLSCLATVFAVVLLLSAAPDNHMGTRLIGCCSVLGPAWTAAILAGTLVSLAKLIPAGRPGAPSPGPTASGESLAYHAALCALAVLSMALAAVARSSRQPRPQLLGTLSAVVTGLLFLLGQHTPLAGFWVVDIGGMLLAIAVAAGVAIGVSVAVLPTLANDEMARQCARALRGLGHNMSSHYSQLLSWADQERTGAAYGAADDDQLPPWLEGASGAASAPHGQLPHAGNGRLTAGGLDKVPEGAPDADPSSSGGGAWERQTVAVASADSTGALLAEVQRQQRKQEREWDAQRKRDLERALLRRRGLDLGAASGSSAPGGSSSSLLGPGLYQGPSFWASALAWFDASRVGDEGMAADDPEMSHRGPHLEAGGAAPREVAGDGRAFASEGQESRAQDEGQHGDLGGGGSAVAPAPPLPRTPFAATAGLEPGGAGPSAEAAPSPAPLLPPASLRPPLAAAAAALEAVDAGHAAGESAGCLDRQSSLVYDEAPPEQYRQNLRMSTYSFLLEKGVRRRRAGAQGTASAGAVAAAGGAIAGGGSGLPVSVRRAPSVERSGGDEFWEEYDHNNINSGTGGGKGGLLGGARAAAPGPPLVRTLLPMLARARALLPSARAEPPWLVAGGGAAAGALGGHVAWEEFIDASERLAMRCSALEGIAQEVILMRMRLEDLQHQYWRIADACAIVSAQLAAFLAELASSIEALDGSCPAASAAARQRRRQAAAGGGGSCRPPVGETFGGAGSWQRPAGAGGQLGARATTGGGPPMGGGAAAAAAAAAGRPGSAAPPREGGAAAGEDPLCPPDLFTQRPEWETARQVLRAELDSALATYWRDVCAANKAAPFRVARAREVMSLMFMWTCCNSLVEAVEQLEVAAARILHARAALLEGAGDPPGGRANGASGAAGAAGSSGGGGGRLGHLRGWCSAKFCFLQPLWQLLFMRPTWDHMQSVVCQQLPAVLTSREARSAALADRTFQAAVKFFVTTAAILVLILALSASDASVRHAQPIFGFVAACVSVQERIEATADKVTLRVVGTVIGASLGEIVMSQHAAANSPYILAAALAVVSAAFGLVAQGPFRVGVSLALFTFVSVILCQYRGCCGATVATSAYFVTRMASVVAGCAWAALVSNLLLPSYTSDWAIDQLTTCIERSATLMADLYRHQYRRMHTAAVRAGLTEGSPETPFPPQGATGSRNGPTISGSGGPRGTGGPDPGADLDLDLDAQELALAARLRPEVVTPLLAVQAAIEKEGVSWKRGPLATPQVARDVLEGLRVLAHAIVAQRVSLSPAPTMAPASLTGHGYFFMGPLNEPWVAVIESVQRMARAAAAQLRRPSKEGADELAAEIELLETLRMRLRGAFLAVRRARHDSVRRGARRAGQQQQPGAQGGGLFAGGADDGVAGAGDTVQFFAWQYSASRCLNDITAVARVALRHARSKLRAVPGAAAGAGRQAAGGGGVLLGRAASAEVAAAAVRRLVAGL